VDIGVKPSFHTLNLCILLSGKFKIEHFEDLHNPLAAREKIENEIQNGRIADPFSKWPIWNLRCSPP
jgi:hypothetical protein